jgi:hypothetical protein
MPLQWKNSQQSMGKLPGIKMDIKSKANFLLKINHLQSTLQNSPLFSWNIAPLHPTFALLSKAG